MVIPLMCIVLMAIPKTLIEKVVSGNPTNVYCIDGNAKNVS